MSCLLHGEDPWEQSLLPASIFMLCRSDTEVGLDGLLDLLLATEMFLQLCINIAIDVTSSHCGGKPTRECSL